MQYKIFNNEILAPLKCGSTYLAMAYPNDIIEITHHSLLDLTGISTIIIREPFEHLQSALHTEILMWYILNPSETLSVDTATPLIKRFINSKSNPDGTNHWDVNYYEHLYKFWKRNKGSIKIVDVSNLTPFLKDRYNIDIEHNKFSYGIPAHVGNFKYAYTTKQKLAKWIETSLPKLWKDLTKKLPKADKFYNLMINGEISEIYELEEKNAELEAQIAELTDKIDELEKWKSEMLLRTKKQLI
jgi:hypothetical protein